MSDSSEYTPPNVWTWNKPSGGQFANVNRPISGPTHERDLPVGRHLLQLLVNRVSGDPSSQLHERHDASDFETKTRDKLAAGS
ncbi:MAG: hypothetical protein JO118_09325 [Acetobacteraceae bacterium]|nr:hypothetical protein [Acetobacteraceae bacterium]